MLADDNWKVGAGLDEMETRDYSRLHRSRDKPDPRPLARLSLVQTAQRLPFPIAAEEPARHSPPSVVALDVAQCRTEYLVTAVRRCFPLAREETLA